ncbi:hypothetical protein [Kibdelosporangium aridum]|nr:hypothetical protein [Kibdelosporangium aridum]
MITQIGGLTLGSTFRQTTIRSYDPLTSLVSSTTVKTAKSTSRT